ncbi:MAG: peptide methionine sulfoxide reductase, peptide-methionine (S)-S-oxide reductase [candidate division WWE3 bacterium CSP1-7]|uniref:Peptide methionine sulfoxide reductase MsrA n=1 Tax=candidate division WWE3 bacterium CSP1-7 TaxID=1576480 RepID=A0A0T5ZYE6_UNCKA|nr:MAG: peptide methionine sulfoxide reductase, peptide-methionine (S)-S-oxide reductase [candidate division WWE3 bacterium CSP1-7]
MNNLETATFAGGCFWCADAVFRMLKGVKSITAGYAGGEKENPTYEEVSSGQTGHVEAVQIEFAPSEISYRELLEVFWHTHNPTEVNRQGPDAGPQYQAAIFYHDEEQKKLAEESKTRIAGELNQSVMTRIIPFKNFFPADENHQDYFAKNPHVPYCQIVIKPKVEKVEKLFHEKLKNA